MPEVDMAQAFSLTWCTALKSVVHKMDRPVIVVPGIGEGLTRVKIPVIGAGIE